MKSKLVLYISLTVLGLTSCGKLLEEIPTTSISKGSAYLSEAALEADLTAVYSGLSVFASNAYCYYLCSASLMQEYTGKRTTDNFLQTHDLTLWSTTPANESIYASLYASVAKCNILLEGLEGSPVDPAYKQKIEGETRMLRALYYFTLTRLYGDLPLITEPVRNVEESFVPRSQYSKVYELIVNDLSFAAENMRTASEMGLDGIQKGRCSNMAAHALLAGVYLQMACYLETPEVQFFDGAKEGRLPDFSFCKVLTAKDALALSLQEAETVITSGVYGLEKNYSHLFRWDPVNFPEDYLSKERIIVFCATPESVTSSIVPWMLWENPVGTESVNIHNGNAGRIRASRWIFQKWAQRYGGATASIGGIEAYVNCPDPRFDASYFHTEVWGVPTGTSAHSGEMVKTTVYPTKLKTSAASDPYIRKYFSPRYKTDNGDADYYILRYADVLLTAAEAAARISVSGSDAYAEKAIGYVNQVLERARKSVAEDDSEAGQPEAWNTSLFADRTALIDAIIWERVFELGNEGHEWFDTHRLGAQWLSDNVCKPLNVFNHQSENILFWQNAFNETDLAEDVQTIRKGLLAAFPEYELRYNTALSSKDQNDFYYK